MIVAGVMTALGIVAPLDELKNGHARFDRVLKRQRSSSSPSSVAKKLSPMALSQQSPTEPIAGRTPASRQGLPKVIEGYWVNSNGRRNIST
jgi:hypothetical protein